VKKAISSHHSSNISFVFLTPPAKMVDILPQMQEAFKNGPIARKVSTSTYISNPQNKSHPRHKIAVSTTTKTKREHKLTFPLPSQIIADAQNQTSPSFYLHWMKSLEMTAAFKHSPTHTQVTFRFPVQREYLNPGGTLHGAAQSLFFDVCTTWLLGPIARKPDYWCSFGTSRSLNVVYLRPAREGDVLTLECEVSGSFPVLFALDYLGMGFGRFGLQVADDESLENTDCQCWQAVGVAERCVEEGGWRSDLDVRASDV
jgi:hypothetical protein